MKTISKNFFTGLLAVALLLGAFTINAFAEDKTVTVNNDGDADYTTIQEAIDYIASLSDSVGWTIEVKNGTYSRFTVPHWNKSGIYDLTISGESRDGVIVNVLNEAYTEIALIDNGGINIYGENVTLENLTVTAGENKQAWDDAAISTNHGMSGGENVSLTVKNCTLIGPHTESGATYGIFWACSELNVTGCDISGFSNAIEFMNDGFNVPAEKTFYISNNTITGSSFAIHGYMGGGNGGGILEITNNAITGSDSLRSKIICQDNAGDSFVVNIKDNTLDNALIGLVNLKDDGDTLCDVLNSNSFGKNSFYVEAIEPGTIDYYTTYTAPESDNGYWALNSIENWESTNPGIDISVVENIIKQANENGSRVLSVTGLEDGTLVKTFTWLKDIVYWASEENTGNSGSENSNNFNDPDGSNSQPDSSYETNTNISNPEDFTDSHISNENSNRSDSSDETDIHISKELPQTSDASFKLRIAGICLGIGSLILLLYVAIGKKVLK